MQLSFWSSLLWPWRSRSLKQLAVTLKVKVTDGYKQATVTESYCHASKDLILKDPIMVKAGRKKKNPTVSPFKAFTMAGWPNTDHIFHVSQHWLMLLTSSYRCRCVQSRPISPSPHTGITTTQAVGPNPLHAGSLHWALVDLTIQLLNQFLM